MMMASRLVRTRARRPLMALATAALLLPLAACDDGYGPQSYGPPPPPPQQGYYDDGRGAPPPGAYGDGRYQGGQDGRYQGYDDGRAPPPPPNYQGGRDGRYQGQGSYGDGRTPPPPPPPGGYRDGRGAPPPPPPRSYDPARDYHGENGSDRAMSRNDQVYQGQDGRYYCKRSDGTTGLIVGAVAGGIFGSLVGGHTLGTLLGAGGGALLGKSVDQGQVRCR